MHVKLNVCLMKLEIHISCPVLSCLVWPPEPFKEIRVQIRSEQIIHCHVSTCEDQIKRLIAGPAQYKRHYLYTQFNKILVRQSFVHSYLSISIGRTTSKEFNTHLNQIHYPKSIIITITITIRSNQIKSNQIKSNSHPFSRESGLAFVLSTHLNTQYTIHLYICPSVRLSYDINKFKETEIKYYIYTCLPPQYILYTQFSPPKRLFRLHNTNTIRHDTAFTPSHPNSAFPNKRNSASTISSRQHQQQHPIHMSMPMPICIPISSNLKPQTKPYDTIPYHPTPQQLHHASPHLTTQTTITITTQYLPTITTQSQSQPPNPSPFISSTYLQQPNLPPTIPIPHPLSALAPPPFPSSPTPSQCHAKLTSLVASCRLQCSAYPYSFISVPC